MEEAEELNDIQLLLLDNERVADEQELLALKTQFDQFNFQSSAIHAEEYRIMNELLEEILLASGVDIDHLPNDCQENLDMLAALACQLGTRDANAEHLIPAICELDLKVAESKNESTRLSNALSKLHRLKNAASLRMLDLERHLESIKANEPSVNQKVYTWRENIKLLEQKQDDYQKRIKAIDVQLGELGVDKLLLADIMEMQRENDELQQCLEIRTRELESFQSLPADLQLAKLALEQKRMELSDLESRRNAALNSIAESLKEME